MTKSEERLECLKILRMRLGGECSLEWQKCPKEICKELQFTHRETETSGKDWTIQSVRSSWDCPDCLDLFGFIFPEQPVNCPCAYNKPGEVLLRLDEVIEELEKEVQREDT